MKFTSLTKPGFSSMNTALKRFDSVLAPYCYSHHAFQKRSYSTVSWAEQHKEIAAEKEQYPYLSDLVDGVKVQKIITLDESTSLNLIKQLSTRITKHLKPSASVEGGDIFALVTEADNPKVPSSLFMGTNVPGEDQLLHEHSFGTRYVLLQTGKEGGLFKTGKRNHKGGLEVAQILLPPHSMFFVSIMKKVAHAFCAPMGRQDISHFKTDHSLILWSVHMDDAKEIEAMKKERGLQKDIGLQDSAVIGALTKVVEERISKAGAVESNVVKQTTISYEAFERMMAETKQQRS